MIAPACPIRRPGGAVWPAINPTTGLLKARLMAAEREKRDKAEAQSRKLQVGSGDRSERIRTYNFPQGRVTDHRINLTLYKLADVMNGRLGELIVPLQQEFQAEELARMTE